MKQNNVIEMSRNYTTKSTNSGKTADSSVASVVPAVGDSTDSSVVSSSGGVFDFAAGVASTPIGVSFPPKGEMLEKVPTMKATFVFDDIITCLTGIDVASQNYLILLLTSIREAYAESLKKINIESQEKGEIIRDTVLLSAIKDTVDAIRGDNISTLSLALNKAKEDVDIKKLVKAGSQLLKFMKSGIIEEKDAQELNEAIGKYLKTIIIEVGILEEKLSAVLLTSSVTMKDSSDIEHEIVDAVSAMRVQPSKGDIDTVFIRDETGSEIREMSSGVEVLPSSDLVVECSEQALIAANARGDDRNLATHGSNFCYWYSISDGHRLVLDIKQRFLSSGYVDADPTKGVVVRAGEEYASTRENNLGILVSDPYYYSVGKEILFSDYLNSDIDKITKQGLYSTIETRDWERLPEKLIIPILSGAHWRIVCTEIDYGEHNLEEVDTSAWTRHPTLRITINDPYGATNVSSTIRDEIIESLRLVANKLLTMRYNSSEFLEITPDNIQLIIKEVDQQGRGENGWDCGPITFSNLEDYVKQAIEGNNLSEFIDFTIPSVESAVHSTRIVEVRQKHLQEYERVTGIPINVTRDQEISVFIQKEIEEKLGQYQKSTIYHEIYKQISSLQPEEIIQLFTILDIRRLFETPTYTDEYTLEEFAYALGVLSNKFDKILREPSSVDKKIEDRKVELQAECNNIWEAIKNGNIREVKRFLDEGFDPKATQGDETIVIRALNEYRHEVLKLLARDKRTDLPEMHRAVILEDITKLERLLVAECKDINLQYQDKMTPLMFAAFTGNILIVKKLLETGADIDLADKTFGKTAIHWAAQCGQNDTIECLIANGVDINAVNKKGSTILHFAAQNGHVRAVELLQGHGVDINAVNKAGNTILHSAADKGHIEIVKFLQEHGADIQAANKDGRTALHFAADKGYTEIVKFLQEHGANMRATDNDGNTALHSAVFVGQKDTIELLIEKGLDVNSVNKNGCTALHSAAFNGYNDIIELLIENGANLNAPDKYGRTVLYYAKDGGHKDTIEFLIEKGVLRATEDCMPALHYAAKKGHNDTVELLLTTKGLDVNAIDRDGRTALHWASLGGHIDIVECLVEHGANVAEKDKYNYTLLHWAAQGGHAGVVKYLVEHGANVNAKSKYGITALHWASLGGHIDTARYLMDHDAKINALDDHDKTPLYLAAKGGYVEAVKCLVEYGGKVSIKTKSGKTALHAAAKGVHVDMVEYLVEHGANVNATTRSGDTALHAAASGYFDIIKHGGDTVARHVAASNRFDMVRYLVEHGANVNAKIDYYIGGGGETPIYLAVRSGHFDMVRYLREHGANVNVKTGYDPMGFGGDTPLRTAIKNGRDDIRQYLLEHGARTDEDGCEDNKKCVVMTADKVMYSMPLLNENVLLRTIVLRKDSDLLTCLLELSVRDQQEIIRDYESLLETELIAENQLLGEL